MIAELFLLLSLFLPGLFIVQLLKIQTKNKVELLILSYIFSLVIMFSLLYLGGILNTFKTMSYIYLAVVIISAIHLTNIFVSKKMYATYFSKEKLVKLISFENILLFLPVLTLIITYTFYLLSRAILDSDVTHYYLPMAREISIQNGFTYNAGYDYNVFLRPIGGAVFYAWSYVVASSPLSETFRLMPLAPIFLLIVLNYALTVHVTKSKILGILSSAIFLVLPFHDRFLLFNAFYPDVFYYPLIFSVIYFIIDYFQFKNENNLLWIGFAFGTAGLLKAQTIYFFITLVTAFLIFNLDKNFFLSFILSCFVPFYLIIVRLFLYFNTSEGFFFVSQFTSLQWSLLLFLSVLAGSCFFITAEKKTRIRKIDWNFVADIIKKISLIIVPFTIMSSLWYINNFVKFGSFLWTSSINLPNYEWALEILVSAGSLETTQIFGFEYFLSSFLFMFADPVAIGYVMLIPLLLGLYIFLKKRNKKLNILFLITIFYAVIIYSDVVMSITAGRVSYNPRDTFLMIPLFTIFIAKGIHYTFSKFKNKALSFNQITLSILLIVYYGYLNYLHSVLIRFSSYFSPMPIINTFMSFFGGIIGFSLSQTSLQLSYPNRVMFVTENGLKILLVSVLISLPVILALVFQKYKIPIKNYANKKIKKKMVVPSYLSFKKNKIVKIATIFVLLSVIIIPRLEIFLAFGGINQIKENQLKKYYGDFYGLIGENKYELTGNILTFKPSHGLPYYLPELKIIDLNYAANLAFLKNILMLKSPYEICIKLKEIKINYILINPHITQEFDQALNNILSQIIQNSELSIFLKNFGVWELYLLKNIN